MVSQTAAAVGSLLLAVSAVTIGDPGTYRVSAGDRPQMVIVNGWGEFQIRKAGRRVTVVHDGRQVEVRRTDAIYEVLREGRTILAFGVFSGPGDGQLIYSPHADPATTEGRFGISTEPESEGLRVTKVVAGSTGERAGFRQGDLIVRIDDEPATPEGISRALRRKNSLTLGVRQGASMISTVLTPIDSAWESPAELQDRFKEVLGR